MTDKDQKRRIMVTVDPDLHRKAKIKAAETGKPMAEILREALKAWVEDKIPKEK